MRMNNYVYIIILMLMSSCGGGKPRPTVKVNTNGADQISFVTPPVTEAFKGEAFSGGVEVVFTRDGVEQTPPSASYYTVRPYSNAECTTLSAGSLSFSRTLVGKVISLTNIKFSGSGDIYVGVVGTGAYAGKACSQKIQVMSAHPANVVIISGDYANGVAGGLSVDPVTFKVLDASGNAVINATLKFGDIVTSGSDSNGLISLKIPLPLDASELAVTAVLEAMDAFIDSTDVNVEVMANVAKTIEILDQPQSTLQTETPSDPILIVARDEFGNQVIPSAWSMTVSPFSDSGCAITADPVDYSEIDDYSFDESDSSSYFSQYLFGSSSPRTVYFKFKLSGQAPEVSVCSAPIIISDPI